jgi:predicted amidophosphoribosyltransferase
MPLRSLVSVVAPPLCVACGASAGRVEPLCARCRAGLRWLPRYPEVPGYTPTWAPLAYEGGARALVRALKFRGAVGLAGPMAAQMAATAPDELLEGFTLVPVPIHPSRLRLRGYNQAEWLALEVGERRGCPVSVCLERVGPPVRQVGMNRLERLESVEHTVRVRDGHSVPERAVIVDDVITTGATIDACAGALYAGGCETAGGFAYARTLGR